MAQFWPAVSKLVQSGRQASAAGARGTVVFPVPFASVPKLTVTLERLDVNVGTPDVAAVTATGFTFGMYRLGDSALQPCIAHWRAEQP